MAKEDTIKIKGTIEEVLPNMHFRVTLENGRQVIAHICGRMRVKNIRISIKDKVILAISPYDLTKGIIIFRER